ncbi:hypothetical protein [Anaerotignum faecicola]|uniref:hypothetical protein n=1 Tax=Anaerotignum faecicola TaxID=2358141 RepID=UPI003FD8D32C
MFERITEKTFDEIFPLLESAFPVTELRMKEDQRALLKEPCYRLYGVRREGVFAATFATWEIEDFLYIEHFAVKEEYRNGGFWMPFWRRKNARWCLRWSCRRMR